MRQPSNLTHNGWNGSNKTPLFRGRCSTVGRAYRSSKSIILYGSYDYAFSAGCLQLCIRLLSCGSVNIHGSHDLAEQTFIRSKPAVDIKKVPVFETLLRGLTPFHKSADARSNLFHRMSSSTLQRLIRSFVALQCLHGGCCFLPANGCFLFLLCFQFCFVFLSFSRRRLHFFAIFILLWFQRGVSSCC